MEPAQDRRSVKTRAALHAAFRALLFERGYDALQVRDVSEAANVGRSTFYEHFTSKADLLRESVAGPFGHLAAMVAPSASPQSIVPVLRHFREHQQMARVLLAPPTRGLLSQALASLLVARLGQENRDAAGLPLEMTARMIADAQLALVEMWIQGRPACAVDAAAAGLHRSSVALAAALTAALGAPAEAVAPASCPR